MSRVLSRPPSDSAETFVLHPGDVVCGQRGDTLETLLGSCVAVILTDPHRTIGAMCHIVHHQDVSEHWELDTLRVGGAMQRMYQLLMGRGMNPQLCDAFVYGGGNMFPDVFRRTNVGRDNGHAVVRRLAIDGIRIAIQDLGGTTYRRISWTVGDDWPDVTATSVERKP